MFKPADNKVHFPTLEQEVLEFWQREKVFEKSVEQNKAGQRYNFYEGPPTANGRPGIHHVLARAFKDVFPRYKTMQGYFVPRRGGWDTHGLPVEVEVEKKLGFKGKQDIEDYGIAAFNVKCRESVWEYLKPWTELTERMGFWVDLPNAYVTYKNDYIETEWWILKTLWDKGLLFQDYKVTMHCPRCNTSLSDAEVDQGRRDTTDPSVYIRMKLAPEEAARLPFASEVTTSGKPVSFLIWTTTPWTLPANTAVALKADADYVLAEVGEELLIVAKAAAPNLFQSTTKPKPGEQVEPGYVVRGEVKGAELVGFQYQAPFVGVGEGGKPIDLSSAYHTLNDEIVEVDPNDHESTGLVHIAPAYGDLEVGRRHGLPTLFSVDLSGNVMAAFPQFAGMFYKKADPDITRDLKERGFLFRSGKVVHNYPFCWRCGTPLLFYAKNSWYVRTTAVKGQLVAQNQQINWYPDNIKNGRFGNWLENNVDWAVSRERYWGTPIPLWKCDNCDQYECVGSVAELADKTGRDLTNFDLHRPFVDELTYPCTGCSGTMVRLPYVLDAWFDSGAMPYAQDHYPFEHQAEFAQTLFPADFISEAIDQTRGWFYSLHALSVLLFDNYCYKNVICLGHILDGEGLKMSKSKGNVVEPWDVFNSQGADALRWYLYTASQPGLPRRFSQDLVSESVRRFMLTLWNTYSFFVSYAELDKLTAADLTTKVVPVAERPLIDRWLVARLNALIGEVTGLLDSYDPYQSARAIESFVDDLSNWYVRRNRRRFWKSENDSDKLAAYQTLYEALVTVSKLAAPFVPFMSEAVYRNLVLSVDPTAPESVHLNKFPVADTSLIDEQLLRDTEAVINAVSTGRAARSAAKLKVRQPLLEVMVKAPTKEAAAGLVRFKQQVLEELNVKEMTLAAADGTSDMMSYVVKPNFKLLGKKLGKNLPLVQQALLALDSRATAQQVSAGQNLTVSLPSGEEVTLTPEEIVVEARQKEGYTVAEDKGYLVALNTTVTEELKREGLLRDLVRTIQSVRKDANFNIADHITTYYIVEDDAEGLLSDLQATLEDAEANRYIQSETLSDLLVYGEPPATAYVQVVDMDGAVLKLGLVKSA
jgi:isoleucyl-tRNA synthetase